LLGFYVREAGFWLGPRGVVDCSCSHHPGYSHGLVAWKLKRVNLRRMSGEAPSLGSARGGDRGTLEWAGLDPVPSQICLNHRPFATSPKGQTVASWEGRTCFIGA